jgi:DNA-binding Xre family transcriptional regulator
VNTNSVRKQWIEKLQDKEYRDGFVSERIFSGLPLKIHVLREQRRSSQKQLGEKTGVAQAWVSKLEDRTMANSRFQRCCDWLQPLTSDSKSTLSRSRRYWTTPCVFRKAPSRSRALKRTKGCAAKANRARPRKSCPLIERDSAERALGAGVRLIQLEKGDRVAAACLVSESNGNGWTDRGKADSIQFNSMIYVARSRRVIGGWRGPSRPRDTIPPR